MLRERHDESFYLIVIDGSCRNRVMASPMREGRTAQNR
jgi:hypothetical protein